MSKQIDNPKYRKAKLKELILYKVVGPFVPAPLLDKTLSLGLAHRIHKTDDEKFTIYFYKG